MTPLEELISGAAVAHYPPKAMRWTPPPADWCTTCHARHDDQGASVSEISDAESEAAALPSDESAARADMRIQVVKRELSQGALAGFDSSVTDYAAKLVIAALDSFDEEALAAEFRRGFEAGEVNAALLREVIREYRRTEEPA